ncbi:hypothetical protein GCM10010988_08620 [Cnuibacter physcomitrellae]|uniref:Uncharacterized protein n=1 Tax=Cnuibacter physcomitrellae TaxID=1619308 RepID=A0A1X9LKJ6_9MICO|nr:DUF6264 family protein [Cnuibacter physcomitrellae]ARJ05736.1 hypothetical protein B5808_11255 [Cnuibacter physcomitrellae]GGI36372.1 hypothetical protein GCM10010988_08620 [Cnuibacter physcomitrellae]
MTDEQSGDGRGEQSDPRPKPKYGELAPPGWTWQPPPDPYAAPEKKPAEEAEPGRGSAPSAGWAPPRTPGTPGPVPGAGPAAAERPRRSGDFVATIALLVFGLFSVINNLVTLFDLDAFLRQFAALYDIQGYSPNGEFSAAGVGVGIFWIVLYLATVWLSVLSLRARRLTFWIPLTAGAVATLSATVLYLVALLSDPTVLDQFSTAPPL